MNGDNFSIIYTNTQNKKPNEQQSYNLARILCQTQQEQYLQAGDELSSGNAAFQHWNESLNSSKWKLGLSPVKNFHLRSSVLLVEL